MKGQPRGWFPRDLRLGGSPHHLTSSALLANLRRQSVSADPSKKSKFLEVFGEHLGKQTIFMESLSFSGW